MSDDQEMNFSELVPDVKPLKTVAKAAIKKPVVNADAAKIRREAASAQLENDNKGLSTEHAPPVSGWDELSYQKPGVQHGVFKKLRLGQYPLDATLDLHRKTVEQSRKELLQFITEAHEMGLRSLLVNHGKAIHRDSKHALVKSFVNYWLPQFDSVLAFHSAQKHHGGTGAVYVLLKKGEKQKQQTRERFSKRLAE